MVSMNYLTSFLIIPCSSCRASLWFQTDFSVLSIYIFTILWVKFHQSALEPRLCLCNEDSNSRSRCWPAAHHRFQCRQWRPLESGLVWYYSLFWYYCLRTFPFVFLPLGVYWPILNSTFMVKFLYKNVSFSLSCFVRFSNSLFLSYLVIWLKCWIH